VLSLLATVAASATTARKREAVAELAAAEATIAS
jgi:hypothetical protein